ncbi:MAG: hypothetical protein HC893_06355 [Chloroflexaceae bacterium]|nr:hypothetical protein [Chloroflexaceae bacterium]
MDESHTREIAVHKEYIRQLEEILNESVKVMTLAWYALGFFPKPQTEGNTMIMEDLEQATNRAVLLLRGSLPNIA